MTVLSSSLGTSINQRPVVLTSNSTKNSAPVQFGSAAVLDAPAADVSEVDATKGLNKNDVLKTIFKDIFTITTLYEAILFKSWLAPTAYSVEHGEDAAIVTKPTSIGPKELRKKLQEKFPGASVDDINGQLGTLVKEGVLRLYDCENLLPGIGHPSDPEALQAYTYTLKGIRAYQKLPKA